MPHWLVSLIPGVSDALVDRLDEMARTHDDLADQLQDPAVLLDHKRVRDLSIRRSALAQTVASYRRLELIAKQVVELAAVIDSGEDPEFAALAREERATLLTEADALYKSVRAGLVTSEDRAVGSVMMELRAGTGGDEAGLWCRDLLRMYERFAAARGWELEALDITADEGMGGIRAAVLNIKGEGVWSELGFEAGVHSVKRVPATETQGRIHTSTATVAILPEPEAARVQIDWAKDVEETVTTSQGPGGQNVNKVATAVQLRHVPTGIIVRMQETKSQQQNRERARRLLLTKLFDIQQAQLASDRSQARRGQIGTGERSEKIRTYRYQEGIVVDQRLDDKFPLQEVLAGGLTRMIAALTEIEIERRLGELAKS